MPTHKELIETQLRLLKIMGVPRKKIEEDLGYSPNYITQQLSKGGNQKLLDAIVDYKERVEEGTEPGRKPTQSELNLTKLIQTNASQQATIVHLTQKVDRLEKELKDCFEQGNHDQRRRSA